VIVLDANILLYAYDSASTLHAKARSWIEEILSGEEPVALPWQTITAFLRIVTNPRFPGVRLTAEDALQIVEEWLDRQNVRILIPGDSHWALLKHNMVAGQVRGPLVSDADLAAITIEFGGILHTTDRDFARFPDLRWTNPLI
jgi:toxin-antitoxin system PIN domain toxin